MKNSNYLDASKVTEENCHGGKGFVIFSRVLDKDFFETPIDYVDHTIIPVSSSIGLHSHGDNEEIYFVLKGQGLMTVDGIEYKIREGDIIKNKRFGSHSLLNDGNQEIEILVIQVSAK